LLTREQQQERRRQQQGSDINKRKIPTVYHVTTGRLSEYTKATYQYDINDFLAFYNITDVSGIEPLKEYSPKLIRQMVKDFVIHLRDVRKVSRSSIKVHCSALSLFFYTIRDDDTRLDWTKVKDEFPPDERIRRDRAYTVDEIQKMISKGCAGRLREKAIILLLTSTGMRIGGIHPLKKGDVIPKTTPQGKRVYQVEVYSSSSAYYSCYCNVETAEAIDEYLKERTDNHEIIQNDSPLFRDLRMLNVTKVKPLTPYNVKYIVSRVVQRSGIKDTFQFTGEAKRSKGLRKFYKTTAELAGMKPINVEKTHGHSIGISDNYYTPTDSQILQDYVDHAAEALTINPTQRLEQENADLRKNRNDYLAELGEFKEEFNEMKRLFVHLSKGTQKQLIDEFNEKVGDKADIEWSCDD
jgi:site-specific recombinase XerD